MRRPFAAGDPARVLLVAVLLAGIALAGARWLEPRVSPATRTDPSIAHRVDLNRAPAGEIAALPGIGEVVASRIVEDRRLRGPFGTLADLERVHGIGPAIVERIRPHVLCGDDEP